MSVHGQVAVSDALEAAGISPERCGRARTGGLSAPERELYRWALRQFAERGRPSGAELRAKSRDFGLEPTAAVGALAREDLVHMDADGEIAVAYPFSGRTTVHKVELAADHVVDAMCAIDALGMAAMLAQPVKVRSSDPTTGEQITLCVEPGGEAVWRPDEAVVLAGSLSDGPSYQSCCGVLNFFASPANAESYLATSTGVTGRLISIPDAVAAGAAVFGEALTT